MDIQGDDDDHHPHRSSPACSSFPAAREDIGGLQPAGSTECNCSYASIAHLCSAYVRLTHDTVMTRTSAAAAAAAEESGDGAATSPSSGANESSAIERGRQ